MFGVLEVIVAWGWCRVAVGVRATAPLGWPGVASTCPPQLSRHLLSPSLPIYLSIPPVRNSQSVPFIFINHPLIYPKTSSHSFHHPFSFSPLPIPTLHPLFFPLCISCLFVVPHLHPCLIALSFYSSHTFS